MAIQHTAVRVSDLKATKAFYEDGLGLEYAWDFHTDDGVHSYYVTGDEFDTEIQFVHDPDADGDVSPDGIGHLAVLVDDADATLERLFERTGYEVRKGPLTIDATDARAAFVEDPDGSGVGIFHRIEPDS